MDETIAAAASGYVERHEDSRRGKTMEIHVSGGDRDDYVVEVKESGSATRHVVTVSPAALEHYGGGATAERLLKESFRFLLEREPKEAILGRFEIAVIGRYFSEYEAEIRRRISSES
jgi:hypothetical protein